MQSTATEIMPIVTAMSDDERVEATVIEHRIEQNLKKFSSLWSAILDDIAIFEAKQLWRGKYDSFHDWWKKRFSRTVLKEFFDDSSIHYQNRRIKALEAAVDCLPGGIEYVPQKEWHARPLTSLETAEQRQEAARIAHEISGGHPTGNDYKRAAVSVAIRGESFEVGDVVYLANKGAAEYGQQFEVLETNAGSTGSLVMAQKVGSNTVLPFTINELSHDNPLEVEAVEVEVQTPRKAQKTSNLEYLSFRASLAEEDAAEARRRLGEAIEIIQMMYDKSPSLQTGELTQVCLFLEENLFWLGS